MDGFFGLVHLNNQNINHLFAVGMTTSDSLADISSYQTQRAGAEDAWIVRVNSSSGQLEKSTYFGGLGSDFGFLLAHNESGSYKSVGDSNSVAIVGNNKSSLASLIVLGISLIHHNILHGLIMSLIPSIGFRHLVIVVSSVKTYPQLP